MLVLDHAPDGITAGALAAAFGVSITNAVTFDGAFVKPTALQAIPGHFLFTRDAGLLGNHPILGGVNLIVTYTGSSLIAPPDATVLLRLPTTANHRVWNRQQKRLDISSAAGRAQAVALEYGRGRVVALAEAGVVHHRSGKQSRHLWNTRDCEWRYRQSSIRAKHCALARESSYRDRSRSLRTPDAPRCRR